MHKMTSAEMKLEEADRVSRHQMKLLAFSVFESSGINDINVMKQ